MNAVLQTNSIDKFKYEWVTMLEYTALVTCTCLGTDGQKKEKCFFWNRKKNHPSQLHIQISICILGNCNLVYTIIRKRNVFHQLANLPTEHSTIAKALSKRGKKFVQLTPESGKDLPIMEGATPAMEAEPGTLKTTLAATPSKYSVGI